MRCLSSFPLYVTLITLITHTYNTYNTYNTWGRKQRGLPAFKKRNQNTQEVKNEGFLRETRLPAMQRVLTALLSQTANRETRLPAMQRVLTALLSQTANRETRLPAES